MLSVQIWVWRLSFSVNEKRFFVSNLTNESVKLKFLYCCFKFHLFIYHGCFKFSWHPSHPSLLQNSAICVHRQEWWEGEMWFHSRISVIHHTWWLMNGSLLDRKSRSSKWMTISLCFTHNTHIYINIDDVNDYVVSVR